MKINARFDPILIFVFSLLAFTLFLNPEFIGFQTRFALFAKTMFQTGITFFPMTYQGAYPDYPGLPTIFIYTLSLLKGFVTPLTAVLPTALTSSFVLVIIYKIAAPLSRAWGWYAACLTILTFLFLQEARSISPDQYITLITALSFYLIYADKKYSPFSIPLLLLLGFAFRGPIGFIIPTGVILSFYAIQKNWYTLFSWALGALALFTLGIVLWLSAAYIQGGASFMHDVITMQVVGRLTGHGYWQTFFSYWGESIGAYAISFPLAILVILGMIKPLQKPEHDADLLLRYLLGYALVILIGLSIPEAKKVRYILPVVPALSLIAGYVFIQPKSSGLLYWMKKTLSHLFFLLPLLLWIATITLFIIFKTRLPMLEAYYGITISLLGALTVISFYYYFRKFSVSAAMAMATLAIIIFNIGINDPINYDLEKTMPLVSQVEAAHAKTGYPIVFYQIDPDAEAIKFAVTLDNPIPFTFIKTEAALNAYRKPAYFIALQKNFDILIKNESARVKPIFYGKIGHRNCVVFTK